MKATRKISSVYGLFRSSHRLFFHYKTSLIPNRNLILSCTITSERVFHHVRTFVPSRWYVHPLGIIEEAIKRYVSNLDLFIDATPKLNQA